MCRQPLSTFYFFCFNILCAQSENTTIAPAMIAVSFITSLPAPVSSGNPCSPLPSPVPILQASSPGKRAFRSS